MKQYREAIIVYLCIAKILRPHGVIGQVKIKTYTSSANSFMKLTNFYLEREKLIKFTSFKKISESEIIASIDNIKSRTETENLKNKDIYIKRSDMPALANNEFYYEDLINLEVISENNSIGKVIGVFDYGASPFLEIKLKDNKIATIQFNSKSITLVSNDKIIINKDFLII